MDNQDDTLTTEEVAQLLKVSKLTVYDLIKKGKLPSFRVGRQIRVERAALEAYKQHGGPMEQPQKGNKTTTTGKRDHSTVIITGQDQCLDILAKELEKKDLRRQALRSHTSSLNGLINMYHDQADIVSTHLYDGSTKTYNIPFIRKILVNQPAIVIHLLKRDAGFFVQKNNPKQITSWENFHDTNLKLVNREQGAGARVLFDEKMRMHDIKPSAVDGYYNELASHTDVANAIANGEADVGIGTKSATKMIGIDFVQMIEESYDLVLLATPENRALINDVKEITNKTSFKKMLDNLGFNTKETGKVLYEQS